LNLFSNRGHGGSVKSTTTFLDFRRLSQQKQRAQSLPDVLDALDTQDCDQKPEPKQEPVPMQIVTKLSQPVTQHWSQNGARTVQNSDFVLNPVTR
jgi:hypothetical protein